ncbi:DUF350 domain-containing protein [Thermodesulfobacteriota bacterium]
MFKIILMKIWGRVKCVLNRIGQYALIVVKSVWYALKRFAGFLEHHAPFLHRCLEALVLLLIGAVTYKGYLWACTWWTPDYSAMSDYLSVKSPSVIVGTLALCLVLWVFDFLTPGSWMRKASETPLSSAIVLAALALALGIILSA